LSPIDSHQASENSSKASNVVHISCTVFPQPPIFDGAVGNRKNRAKFAEIFAAGKTAAPHCGEFS